MITFIALLNLATSVVFYIHTLTYNKNSRHNGDDGILMNLGECVLVQQYCREYDFEAISLWYYLAADPRESCFPVEKGGIKAAIQA